MLSLLTLSLLLLHNALAHSGHSLEEELAQRGQWLKTRPRSIESCAEQLQKRGHLDDAITRREELLRRARLKRGIDGEQLERRDFRQYDFSHASKQKVSPKADARKLFAGSSNCVLTPEIDVLGHYIADGLVRSVIHDNQPGIPMHIDVQVINTRTCKPMPNVYLDIYQCNSTGVYSGVVAEGNGNGFADPSNIRANFGRGVQRTDANGVAQFESKFPGHYFGVANHLHVLTHKGLPKGTPPDAQGRQFVEATHNGRIFFDQSLISKVEALPPYNMNRQPLTLNHEDQAINLEAAKTDPFARYAMVGDRLEDGIVAWMSVGVDPQALHPLAYLNEGHNGNGG
ncbi:hypothetical protein HII31_05767 [Pseudocercospora fuligena]|uniref:Intradiol ring-cleavage dioxygenases domain-containing protein n=1 Tax=Pseudocercospora fuligena TaxID=685502 RepID=A0A8H6VJN0_9PEZI|nr:hypothetical protein HII31_05767 [Pseudocercospora fuligena]